MRGRWLFSNTVTNGGGNGEGNGPCNENSTQDLQCNLLHCTEFGSFVFLVTSNLVYKCQFACRDGSRESLYSH